MSRHPTPLTPVSWGELIDKITILEIKRERLSDAAALANVAHELALLAEIAAPALAEEGLADLKADLKAVNIRLWEIEDDIRDDERKSAFGETFIGLARSVYRINDERALLKRRINHLLGSELTEEKSYKPY